MRVRTGSQHQDLVPLGERLRWIRMFRLASVTIIGISYLVLPEVFLAGPMALSLVTGAYLGFSLLVEGLWRISGRRALPVFGVMLIIDGLFLAWASWAITEPEAPLRYLVVVHIVTVTLLASFRTGLKLAMWHSLLLLTFFHLGEIGVLDPDRSVGGLGGVAYQALVASIVVFWLAGIATASFSSVNERELRRRRYDLEALAHLSDTLECSQAADAMTQALVEAVDDAFEFDRVALVRLDDDGMVLSEQRRATLDHVGERGVSRLIARAASGRETLLVTNLRSDDEPWLAALLPSATNLVLVPLQADAGAALAVLVCEHGMRSDSRIEQRVVAALERFASVAALSVRRAQLLEQLQHTAMTDGLTGVANRRTFDTTLGRELASSLRTGSPLSLVMVDIDHFKKLNDTLGHVAGDHVLREVAQGLADASRAADLVARYGGEEFAVLLPDTDADTAEGVALRLHAAVAGAGRTASVTASVGIATHAGPDEDSRALVEAADRALYAAKHGGRDRVTRADRIVATESGDAAGA